MSNLTLKGLDGSDKSLVKINQDAYSGEYFKRDGNVSYSAKVRHNNETASKNSTVAYARHNIDVTATTYSVDSSIPPQVIQAYIVLRHPLAATDAQIKNLSGNLLRFLEENDLNRLIGWETDLVSNES